MRLLLVEDNDSLRESQKEIIKDYDNTIQVIEATSFATLEEAIFANTYDGAIVDNTLSAWDKSRTTSNYYEGVDICKLIRDTNSFNPEKHIVLYTAEEKFTYKKNEDFRFIDKDTLLGVDIDYNESFKSIILEPLIEEIENVKSETLSLEKFNNFAASQKRRYYKSIFTDKRPNKRFQLNIAEEISNVLLTSDFKGQDGAMLFGHLSKEKNSNRLVSEKCDYTSLDRLVTKNDAVPFLQWNFKSPELFEIQYSQIKDSKFNNDFVKDFFNVAFSKNFAYNLVHKEKELREITDVLNLISLQDEFVIREIQCEMITEMANRKDKSNDIRDYLRALFAKTTKYEIVDYFDCTLSEFNKEENIAYVELVSKINPNEYFTRQFRYDRLVANGVKYKEGNFLYCVSQYDGELKLNIEPKN